ncbi:aldehyde dehydrogenase family protein [Rhodococcus koreensis]|uniref:Acyl-CoA reductase n=1 Tax=Rhodococcus koreensis TaxID=99653 RepID=A0A1H4L196_9NOCA|nr:aldehyde dehydrogenase family protein [Rhodococcus koreensis]SEB64517.1 Acyl-CoA reductase [Rhodococcus koreensis]
MSNYSMTIGGELISGSATFAVEDPALGAAFAVAPNCTDSELDKAVAAAEAAFPRWRSDDTARRSALLAAAGRVEERVDELGALLTREQGRPLAEAIGEIRSAVDWLRYYAGLEVSVEVLQDNEYARVELLREPIGPVAAITPWNAPVGLAFWKVAPALRAGNTVVVKPSPYTPLTTLRIGELLADVFPPGVLNVISGLDPLGAKLSAHHAIRKISFTGSTSSGRKVAAAAAEGLKRVTLELGGNDPAIVLDDADVETAAAGIFGSSMINVGQICVAVKRTYVPRRLYGDMVSALVERAKAVRIGNGLEEGTTHGPLNNQLQLERVEGLVRNAVDAGATVAAGGSRIDGPGFFYAPTILTDVTDSMPVVAEEQFGPALPVLPYDDLDDAIARANATHFGLGSSIWTSDADRGAQLARRIAAGTTWVNCHLYLLPHLPFGGVKSSGLGVENGPWGLHEFTDMHVVYKNLVPGTPWS